LEITIDLCPISATPGGAVQDAAISADEPPLGQLGQPILLQTRHISKLLSKTYLLFPRHRIRATHFAENIA